MVTPRETDEHPIDRQRHTVVQEEGVTPVVHPAVPPVTPVVGAPVVSETVAATPAQGYRESMTVDYGAERHAALRRTTQFVSFFIGLIVALIGLRVVLRLIAANPDNGFAQFIYGITAPLVAPFAGLTATPNFSGAALEISSIIAIVIYLLVGWAITKLIWLLFYRPSTRDASTTTYQRG